jgi:hypothetical protein
MNRRQFTTTAASSTAALTLTPAASAAEKQIPTSQVDLAVGLGGGRILAPECRVSNDRTNSIKRINDVLKKAAGWQTQWGRFVITGALLQGVFSDKEPCRLPDDHVRIFWSHRRDLFRDWIAAESAATEPD